LKIEKLKIEKLKTEKLRIERLKVWLFEPCARCDEVRGSDVSMYVGRGRRATCLVASEPPPPLAVASQMQWQRYDISMSVMTADDGRRCQTVADDGKKLYKQKSAEGSADKTLIRNGEHKGNPIEL